MTFPARPDGGSVQPGQLGPGAQLGRYQLLRRLAVGGMGEVYLARATGIEGFEKLVVLKSVLPQYVNNAEIMSMFLDEARLAARIHHPNIAQVYDIGRVQNVVFFTMEYIHGEDSRNLMEKYTSQHAGGLPLEVALSIIIGTAAGLQCAHELVGPDGKLANLVHRDVSPSNVLVSYDGSVKLVDFGVAKVATKQSETRAGTLKGKVAYMSPEQCIGMPLDRRSDVFALGILLHEMVTGARLFRGQSELAILKQIADQDVPPPSWEYPSFPPELERIVLRALARDRNQRYATAEEMQIDLENFARELKLAVSPVTLARFMKQLYGNRVDAWNRAQQAGKTLGQHLAEQPEDSNVAMLNTSSGLVMEEDGNDGRTISEQHIPSLSDEAPIAPSLPGNTGATARLGEDQVKARRNRNRVVAGAAVASVFLMGAVIFFVQQKGSSVPPGTHVPQASPGAAAIAPLPIATPPAPSNATPEASVPTSSAAPPSSAVAQPEENSAKPPKEKDATAPVAKKRGRPVEKVTKPKPAAPQKIKPSRRFDDDDLPVLN